MGSNVFAALFEQIFTSAPDTAKYALAPMLMPHYLDVQAKLNCMESCEWVSNNRTVIDAAIRELEVYMEPASPGGGT